MTDLSTTPAVLLAGGLARRMGGADKPLQPIAGRPLLARVIDRLAPQCGGLVLNVNGDLARYAAFGLPMVSDPVAGFPGPLAGVLAGLDWVAANHPEAETMLSAPADCPFLPADLVARLHHAREQAGAHIVVATSGGRIHPVIALWPIRLREVLRTALTTENVRKVDDFTARFPRAEAAWPAAPHDPFFNVNTPDDLAEAERIAALDRA